MSESINKTNDLGFFQYVFNFDDEHKAGIMNMLQYTILSVIPVMIILKLTKHIIPEEDENKGSLEIVLESATQIIIIMLAIWFTNRIINYIPTYSGEKYLAFNEISFIIPFMIILATMQTKLGAKFNILMERTINIYKGVDITKGKPVNNAAAPGGVVRVTQPLAVPHHQPSQSDYLDRNQLLPSNPQLTAMPPQQGPDFNQMYQNQSMQGTSMQGGGMQEGMMMDQGPMAANEAVGGGGFGSLW
jgi:hypothetical protein